MRRALPLALVTGLAAAALAWQGGQAVRQMQQDGKTVSTNLRVVDGTLMVSAKDVASFLGGDLVVANGTATVVARKAGDQPGGTPYQPTGAAPAQLGSSPAQLGAMGALGGTQPFLPEAKRPDPKELTVKVGDDADNDGFALRVVSVEEPKGDYRTTLDPRGRKVGARLKDDRLVVVRMRLENRTDETRRPPIPSGLDVTLFGEDRVGVPVVAFDARPQGNPDLYVSDLAPYDDLQAPILAPKGVFEFNAVFSLPKGQTPTRLTVALPAASDDKGGANVTVALQ